METLSEEWKHLPDGYKSFFVKLMFFSLFFVNLFMNIDMGIMAAGTTSIKPEFKLNNSQYGTLGSAVYFG